MFVYHDCEWVCISTFKSKHLPKRGEVLSIDPDNYDHNPPPGLKKAYTFKVQKKITVFSLEEGSKDDCNSIEVYLDPVYE
jgi:hypothetical protein